MKLRHIFWVCHVSNKHLQMPGSTRNIDGQLTNALYFLAFNNLLLPDKQSRNVSYVSQVNKWHLEALTSFCVIMWLFRNFQSGIIAGFCG